MKLPTFDDILNDPDWAKKYDDGESEAVGHINTFEWDAVQGFENSLERYCALTKSKTRNQISLSE